MLFSSFVFIFVFLPLVWIGFHLLKSEVFARFCARLSIEATNKRVIQATNPYTFAKLFLIASSLFFYAFWKLAYLPILLGSIAINYALAKLILKNSAMSFVLKSTSANNGGGAKTFSRF